MACSRTVPQQCAWNIRQAAENLPHVHFSVRQMLTMFWNAGGGVLERAVFQARNMGPEPCSRWRVKGGPFSIKLKSTTSTCTAAHLYRCPGVQLHRRGGVCMGGRREPLVVRCRVAYRARQDRAGSEAHPVETCGSRSPVQGYAGPARSWGSEGRTGSSHTQDRSGGQEPSARNPEVIHLRTYGPATRVKAA